MCVPCGCFATAAGVSDALHDVRLAVCSCWFPRTSGWWMPAVLPQMLCRAYVCSVVSVSFTPRIFVDRCPGSSVVGQLQLPASWSHLACPVLFSRLQHQQPEQLALNFCRDAALSSLTTSSGCVGRTCVVFTDTISFQHFLCLNRCDKAVGGAGPQLHSHYEWFAFNTVADA
jgi:hypothetical protein